MAAGEIHDLIDLRLRNLVCEYTAYADTAPMNMQHDSVCFLCTLTKKPFKDMNDELHWRVIVVQKEHFVHRRLLCSGFGPDGNPGARAVPVILIIVAHFVIPTNPFHSIILDLRAAGKGLVPGVTLFCLNC